MYTLSDVSSRLRSGSFDFESLALDLFRFQATQVPVYRDFVQLLGIDPKTVTELALVPFLPVSFFKTHRVADAQNTTGFCFSSSTTGGGVPSRHYVPDLDLYNWSFTHAFSTFYGSPENYCILGLLPSYLERSGSSLVYMTESLIRQSRYPQSNFFLHNFEALYEQLLYNEAQKIPTLLIGVTYALLDFAEQFPMPLHHTTVMETGGMKGRREELQREAVHARLMRAFQVPGIHSEYGMTEMLSQAYSSGSGIFNPPSTLRVLAAEINDPLTHLPSGRAGALHLVDLCNIHSCAFLATDDLGLLHADGSFEVLGRKDHSDVRGCSLMYQ